MLRGGQRRFQGTEAPGSSRWFHPAGPRPKTGHLRPLTQNQREPSPSPAVAAYAGRQRTHSVAQGSRRLRRSLALSPLSPVCRSLEGGTVTSACWPYLGAWPLPLPTQLLRFQLPENVFSIQNFSHKDKM